MTEQTAKLLRGLICCVHSMTREHQDTLCNLCPYYSEDACQRNLVDDAKQYVFANEAASLVLHDLPYICEIDLGDPVSQVET